MRYFLAGLVLLIALTVGVLGFRGSMSRKPPLEIFPDMDRQPKLRPQTFTTAFGNQMSSRPPVPGTIARNSHFQEVPLTTGRITGTTNFVEINPMPITATLMARGRERYQINCAPCHGGQGDGNGITKRLGMGVVANLHDKRIVVMPDGEIFNTITHGKNLMLPYGPNVVIEDRWAIVAYVRALQLSRLGSTNEVPAQLRASLK